MSLTRRHYVLLAEALHDAKPIRTVDYEERKVTDPSWTWQAEAQWIHDVETISRTLSADNPRGFDKAQFLVNCRQNEKERTI